MSSLEDELKVELEDETELSLSEVQVETEPVVTALDDSDYDGDDVQSEVKKPAELPKAESRSERRITTSYYSRFVNFWTLRRLLILYNMIQLTYIIAILSSADLNQRQLAILVIQFMTLLLSIIQALAHWSGFVPQRLVQIILLSMTAVSMNSNRIIVGFSVMFIIVEFFWLFLNVFQQKVIHEPPIKSTIRVRPASSTYNPVNES